MILAQQRTPFPVGRDPSLFLNLSVHNTYIDVYVIEKYWNVWKTSWGANNFSLENEILCWRVVYFLFRRCDPPLRFHNKSINALRILEIIPTALWMFCLHFASPTKNIFKYILWSNVLVYINIIFGPGQYSKKNVTYTRPGFAYHLDKQRTKIKENLIRNCFAQSKILLLLSFDQ